LENAKYIVVFAKTPTQPVVPILMLINNQNASTMVSLGSVSMDLFSYAMFSGANLLSVLTEPQVELFTSNIDTPAANWIAGTKYDRKFKESARDLDVDEVNSNLEKHAGEIMNFATGVVNALRYVHMISLYPNLQGFLLVGKRYQKQPIG
jgi:hypothetical protein